MHVAPFRVNFSDPTLLALDRIDKLVDQPHLDVITLPDSEEEQWIWMVITAPDKVPQNGGRIFFPAAHPMHLHGHDFAVLRQSHRNWYNDSAINHVGDRYRFQPHQLNCDNPRLNCNNPPRRDVILLPASGYVIIAFKADNPGYVSLPSSFFPPPTAVVTDRGEQGLDLPLSHCLPRLVGPGDADHREQGRDEGYHGE